MKFNLLILCSDLAMALSIFLLFSTSICFLASSQDLLSVNAQSHNLTQPPVTPINYDLYHSSGNLMEEIRALVHRHPDKLTMETIKAANKGYGAEVTVVTYCKERKRVMRGQRFGFFLVLGSMEGS
ncbi:carboxypeptidase B2 [Spatholobus suberectus]|nr:carboxypeptidase B2 [Spatholobus suberectus]